MTMVKQYSQMCVRSALLISPRFNIYKQSSKTHLRAVLNTLM